MDEDGREALGILAMAVIAMLIVAGAVAGLASFVLPKGQIGRLVLIVITAPVFALVVDLVYGSALDAYDRRNGGTRGQELFDRWLALVVLVAAGLWVVAGALILVVTP
jgi:hypothetical protein